MSEARTVREARLAIREVEAAIERIHMAPATALAQCADWYLRKARLALRQAERWFARADDPRLESLPPLRAQIRDRRPTSQPRRRRYRCAACFTELLRRPDESLDCPCRGCDGALAPVGRLTRKGGRS